MDKLKLENKYKIFKPAEGFMPPSLEELPRWLRRLVVWIEGLYKDIASRVNRNLGSDGSITWDPGNLIDGAGETSSSITVNGAALGDFVMVSAPYDLQDCVAVAYVQAADTVEIRLQNESGGARNLASGTWRVKVIKK